MAPKRPAKSAAAVRLLPAAMVTVGALLGVKAVAMAADVAEPAAAAASQSAHAEPASAKLKCKCCKRWARGAKRWISARKCLARKTN